MRSDRRLPLLLPGLLAFGLALPASTWANDGEVASTWRVDPEERRASSVGAPNDGRLKGGVRLPAEGPGFLRRKRGSQWGTDETIALTTWAAGRMAEAFPGTAPLVVGDISRAKGGRIRPHRSHQSGRDVDIAFPEKGNRDRTRFNGKLRAGGVDFDKAWFVLESLLLTDRVEYIFADRKLLGPLAKAARRAGWPESELDPLILMPGEKGYRGIIRHAPGHGAHFHVRFKCPEGDDACATY